MQTWLKVTIGIVASLIIIFVVGGYIFYNTLTASLPDYEGRSKCTYIERRSENLFR